MPEILLATRNPGKVREIRHRGAALGVRWRSLEAFADVPDAVEDADTFAANARSKALHFARATGLLTLADDSGLVVDALGGAPGVRSARYAGQPKDDAANNRKLIANLRGVPPDRRTARFCCAMALVTPEKVLAETTGTVEGLICDEPRGDNGFGYDPHFLLPELGRTMAELSREQKHAISHRGRALRAMLAEIGRLFPPAPAS